MGYLTAEARAGVHLHRYRGEDHSKLVKWFLGRFWDFCISLFPLWVAPNLITFMGLVCIIINFCTILFFAPNLQQAMPTWTYLSFATGIFVYQILDNIDGRQARRTGSSSPLGELFDHGCDSLFVTLSGTTIIAALMFTPWRSFAYIMLTACYFYFFHWEEWHTGVLVLGTVGNPTEAQLLMMLMHFLTAFYGPEFWSRSSQSIWQEWTTMNWPFLIMNANTFVLILTVINGIFVSGSNVQTVRPHIKSLKETLLLLVPFVTHTSFTSLWYYTSSAQILENYTIAAIVFYGFMISYTIDRMMVDRVTKVKFNVWNPVFLLPVIGCVHSLLNRDATADFWVFVVILSMEIFCYVHFLVSIVRELCDELKIHCFRIVPKMQTGQPTIKAEKRS